MTLTEFLLARIDEDQERVRDIKDYARPMDEETHAYLCRALDDYDVKRRIVRRCADALDGRTAVDEADGATLRAYLQGYRATAPSTLRDLASVYADHPEYRQEWAP